MNTIKVIMTREKETPGTVVFKEVPASEDAAPVIKTLYIQKDVPGIAEAQAIEVSVTIAG